MRLFLLGTLLTLALTACGADTGGSADPAAAPSTAASAQSGDNALAKAAEELAKSATDIPTEIPPAPELPSEEPEMTITADPSTYVVPTPIDETSDDCATIWRSGKTLPSPYDGCMDDSGLVAAEGHARDGGIYYDYKGLCAREDTKIRAC